MTYQSWSLRLYDDIIWSRKKTILKTFWLIFRFHDKIDNGFNWIFFSMISVDVCWNLCELVNFRLWMEPACFTMKWSQNEESYVFKKKFLSTVDTAVMGMLFPRNSVTYKLSSKWGNEITSKIENDAIF